MIQTNREKLLGRIKQLMDRKKNRSLKESKNKLKLGDDEQIKQFLAHYKTRQQVLEVPAQLQAQRVSSISLQSAVPAMRFSSLSPQDRLQAPPAAENARKITPRYLRRALDVNNQAMLHKNVVLPQNITHIEKKMFCMDLWNEKLRIKAVRSKLKLNSLQGEQRDMLNEERMGKQRAPRHETQSAAKGIVETSFRARDDESSYARSVSAKKIHSTHLPPLNRELSAFSPARVRAS